MLFCSKSLFRFCRFPQEALKLARYVGVVHLQRRDFSTTLLIVRGCIYENILDATFALPGKRTLKCSCTWKRSIGLRKGQRLGNNQHQQHHLILRYVARVDTLDKKDLDDAQTVYQAFNDALKFEAGSFLCCLYFPLHSFARIFCTLGPLAVQAALDIFERHWILYASAFGFSRSQGIC